MRFYLQIGWGMMGHVRELLSDWAEGGAILSPRDMEPQQLVQLAGSVARLGGEPLLDPQCFAHDADHARLNSHDYWQAFRSHSTSALLDGPGTSDVLSRLAALAQQCGITRHILPGILANPVNDDWFAVHDTIIEEAQGHFDGQPLLATIALSSEALRDETQVEAVVERAASWDVEGYYVVAETPSAYLVQDPTWLANLLILAAGLKLTRRFLLVGYCSHQMLCLSASNTDAIASGTWLNVRAFPPSKFYVPDPDAVSRRALWYYCPQALSEYKIQFLDIARRVGVLDMMRPDSRLGSTYADPLFSGAIPTSIDWGEPRSFRHYLACLRAQAAEASATSYQGSVSVHQRLLASAEQTIERLRQSGVLGGDRDFSDSIDVNRAALAVLDSALGPRLRRQW